MVPEAVQALMRFALGLVQSFYDCPKWILWYDLYSFSFSSRRFLRFPSSAAVFILVEK